MKCFTFIACIVGFVALFYLWLNTKRNLATRYQAKYGVVTGCNGGIGREVVSRLLDQMHVIGVARNQSQLDEMAKQFTSKPHKFYPFVFNLSGDLSSFAEKFDQFLTEQNIPRKEIGFCHSNAGYGMLGSFEKRDLKDKLSFMHLNVDSHVMVADYFMKLFVERKKRSGFVVTASLASNLPTPGFVLYHTAKAALASMGNALYAEYKRKGIDVLTVNPAVVRETGFYTAKTMAAAPDTMLNKMEASKWKSTTPKEITDRIFCRIGKVSQTYVGILSNLSALLSQLGREANGQIFSLMSLGEANETK